MAKAKYYVVWEGRQPGIYDNWDDCLWQIDGYSGAKYKGFKTLSEATEAFRGNDEEEGGIIRTIAGHTSPTSKEQLPVEPVDSFSGPAVQTPNRYADNPSVNPDAIAVDGAASGNPGPMEYRGVRVGTGEELFHVGPIPAGTNNIAEYLALVHAFAYLYRQGDTTTPIYSDSIVGRSWLRNRGSRSGIKPSAANAKAVELLARADAWLQTHNTYNPLLTWNTALWGEIPADFGRK